MGRRRKYFPALLALAAFLAGCGFPPSRTDFIQILAANNRKIARSTRDFRTAVLPLKDGKPADAARMRSAYQTMEKTLKEVRADADDQLLPLSSSSAKDVLTAYRIYVDAQQDILTTLMKQILDVATAPGDDPPIAARWVVIEDIMKNKIPAKEAETWGPLAQAQKAYASEHNYQVEDLAQYEEAQKSGK